MAAPILLFTNCCFNKIPMAADNSPKKLGNHLFIVAPIVDTLISLTCLVVGILGATGVIAMPAAAAYALIGVSGAITLGWIALTLKVLYENSKKSN
jgi:hypothetical protein